MEPFAVGLVLGGMLTYLACSIHHTLAIHRLQRLFEMEIAGVKKEAVVAAENAQKLSKLRPKLQRVTAIAAETEQLLSMAQQPSKSASHSHYKNQIVEQIKALEAEKFSLLQEVLDAGYNPKLSVSTKGVKEVLLLTDYLARHNMTRLTKTDTITPPIPKLKLVREEVTDDSSTGTPS